MRDAKYTRAGLVSTAITVSISGGFIGSQARAQDPAPPPELTSSQAAPSPNETATVSAIPVDSQTAPIDAPSEEERSRSRLVEEIVVTAQKRKENIQDVPISVAAFGADQLDARGVENVQDLQVAVPGLNYGGTGGYAVVFMRGLGTDAFLFADPSVALYVDGVYFPFARGTAQAFGAVERVEVLKGPQGTLFGRNAVGGAINVVTKDPGQEPEVSIESSYGNFNRSYNRVYANLPLADSLAVSVAGYYNTEDNFYDGRIGVDQRSLPNETSKAGRVKLKWSPLDNMDLVLAALSVKGSGTGTMYEVNAASFPVGATLGIRPQTGYHGDVDGEVYNTLIDRAQYGRLEMRFDPLDVKLLGSHEYVTTGGLFDFDGSPQPLATFSNKQGDLYSEAESGEIQLISNDTSWASTWLKWIGGFYYFHSDSGQDPATFDIGNVPAILAQLPIDLPLNASAAKIDIYGQLLTTSYAAYAQTTASLTERLSLTLGGRWSDEKRRIGFAYNRISILGLPDLPLLVWPKDSTRTKDFSPKVSLEYRPADDVLLYLSWQEAVKQGSFNVLTLYTPPAEVDPEKVAAWELGLKSTVLDGLVQFNAAAFHYDDRDLQVQFVSLLNRGAVSFENADSARIYGLDVDGLVQVLPSLFNDLVLTFSGEYLHARYRKYDDASQFDPTTGVYNRNGNFKGKQIVRSPDFTGSVGLNKVWSVGPGSLEIGGDLYVSDHYFFLSQNSEIARQDSFKVFNARVSYLFEPWGLRATLFGQNLNDGRYSQGPLFTDFGRLDHLAAPRTYGLRLNWDF